MAMAHPAAPCPPCKIILDGGVLIAALDVYGTTTGSARAAFLCAIDNGTFDGASIDQAHALSELWCHRAALLRQWAEEDRLMATAMIGGEYRGAWSVDGVNGITPK